jgi:hypothetical protein
MGRNLVYNICDHGYTVAGFDKDLSKVETLEQRLGNFDLCGTHSVREFTEAVTATGFPNYSVGTQGPADAEALIARDGHNWIVMPLEDDDKM